MTGVNSQIMSVQDGKTDAYEETVIDGFTYLPDKAKRKKPQVSECLPYWIRKCHLIPDSLDKTVAVDDMESLSPLLKEKLKNLGYHSLFPIQYSVIPAILNSYNYTFNYPRPRDICVSAPTGSGKTLVYVLPIIQLLANRRQCAVRVLVVLPVRDLAKQVHSVFEKFVENTGLKVALLIGETSLLKEQASLVKVVNGYLECAADIVICTPGRLVEHLRNTHGFHLYKLRLLIIDEADRVLADEKQHWFTLLERSIYRLTTTNNDDEGEEKKLSIDDDLKRVRPVNNVLSQMNAQSDITLQKILLSATLTHDPEPIKQFRLMFPSLYYVGDEKSSSKRPPPDEEECHSKVAKRRKLNDSTVSENAADDTESPDIVTESQDRIGTFTTPVGLKEYFVSIKPLSKPLFLIYLVRKLNMKRILCFVNSREETNRLFILLEGFADINAMELSARLPLTKRERILSMFTAGDIQILVSSDAVARGIDIADVDCVVSYDKPREMKTYVHRIGRTARAGKSGTAYTLLELKEIHHFKRELKSVGKTKLKEFPFKISKYRSYQREYNCALNNLKNIVTNKNSKESKKFPARKD